MSKLLDKDNIITFLNYINKQYLKNDEVLIISPKIREEFADRSTGNILIKNVYMNTYIKIYNKINQINISEIINNFDDLNDKKNKIFIQFETEIDNNQPQEIIFKNNIAWKDGRPITLSPNHLYLIELTCGKNYIYGEYMKFDISENNK